MAKNEIYKKKIGNDGNPIIENGDFVMEIIYSKEVDDQAEIIDDHFIDNIIDTMSEYQLQRLKEKLENI